MDLSTIVTFLENHLFIIISCLLTVASFIVNIIISIKERNVSKLKEVLASIPEVIRSVELLSNIKKLSSVEKKAAAESLLIKRFGESFVLKNISVFDAAIEDILNTPEKKGETYGLQKENA